MVREEHKKAQKWSGRSPRKGSECSMVSPKKGPEGAQKKAQKRTVRKNKKAQGSEMVRGEPKKTAQKRSGRSPKSLRGTHQCGVTKNQRFRVILFGARLTLARGLNPSRRGPRSPRATAPSPRQAKLELVRGPVATRYRSPLLIAAPAARSSLGFRVYGLGLGALGVVFAAGLGVWGLESRVSGCRV